MEASASARRAADLRLALLPRRQIGFEHRDLRIAPRARSRAGSWRSQSEDFAALLALRRAGRRCPRDRGFVRLGSSSARDAIRAREQLVFERRNDPRALHAEAFLRGVQ